MIYIQYDEADKQRITEKSLFITFEYDEYLVSKMRELKHRFYHPKTREWEVPTIYLDDIKKLDEVTIKNKETKEIKEIDRTLFKTQPFPHQEEGIKYGINKDKWLLADQQGLGKTKQVIDIAIYKKHHENLKHCLIVCGVNKLKYNWLREIEVHSNEKGCILGARYAKYKGMIKQADKEKDLEEIPEEFFWITNIETLRMKKIGNKYQSPFVNKINELIDKGELGMVIVDEIHKAKNSTSQQGRGLLAIKPCVKIGLSGTLVVNNPLDLYMPLKFIDRVKESQWYFNTRYTTCNNFGQVLSYKNLEELQLITNTCVLRRTKNLLKLPPKIHVNEIIEMSEKEKTLYNKLLTSTLDVCDKITNPVDGLSKLTRLRQVCCHTGLVTNTIGESSKFERLQEILEEARLNDDKVIVFSEFRQLVEKALVEFAEFNPLKLYGGMNKEEFDYQIDTFQKSKGFQVIFCVIKSAGAGITLNKANTVVFLDLPWTYADYEQAEDRAHRIGTDSNVIIINLLMKDSIDEKMYDTILSKKKISEEMIFDETEQKSKLFKEIVRKLKEKGEE